MNIKIETGIQCLPTKEYQRLSSTHQNLDESLGFFLPKEGTSPVENSILNVYLQERDTLYLLL